MFVFIYIVEAIISIVLLGVSLSAKSKEKYYICLVFSLLLSVFNMIFVFSGLVSRLFFVNMLLVIFSMALAALSLLFLVAGYERRTNGKVNEIPKEKVTEYEERFQPESPETLQHQMYGYAAPGTVESAPDTNMPQQETRDFSYRFSSPAGTCQVIGKESDYKIVFEGKDAIEYYVSGGNIVGYKVAQKNKIMEYGE